MELPIIEVKNVKKKYILGNFGTGSFTNDFKSWIAKKTNKPDPNAPIVEGNRRVGDVFMALNDISFNVNRGERVGIIGGNGAGKSTILKILSRITAPSDGEVTLRGRVTSMLEVGTGFNPEMTGRENIYLNGAILGMTKAEIDSKLQQIIDFSEVEEFIDTPVKRYSSGMYVKLAFSVSAHLDSEILIMDEVLAVGDANFQKKCIDKMQATASDQNRTILFVSHAMGNIETLCNRVIVLNQGKIVFDGDTKEGIKKYLAKAEISPMIFKEFKNYPKDALSIKCQLMSAKILNKEIPEFVAGETLRVEAIIDNRENIEGTMQRWMIKNNYGPIATSFSDMQKLKPGVATYNIEFDTSILANGDYSVDWFMGIFDKDNFIMHTQQVNAISFKITGNKLAHNSNWSMEAWGSCIGGKLKITEQE